MEKKTENWNEMIFFSFDMVTGLTRDVDVKIKISDFHNFDRIVFLHFNCNVFENSSSFNKSVCQDQLIILIIHQSPRSFNDIFWKWPKYK